MKRAIAVLRPAAASLGALFLLSCWQPVFEADISSSESMVKKFGDPVWSAAVSLAKTFDGGYFVPPRDTKKYGEGFWINRRVGSELRIGSVEIINSLVFNPNPGMFDLKDEAFPGGVVRSAGAASKILYVGMDRMYGIVRADRQSVWNRWTINGLAGVGIAPDARVDRDVLSMLGWPIGSDAMYLSKQAVSGLEAAYPPDPAPAPVSIAKTPPQRFSGMAYAGVNPADSSLIVSGTLADGTVRTYRWPAPFDTTVPTELSGIPYQVTGMLSDGSLLADMGSLLYVYTKDGVFSQAIKTGPLRFAHERLSDPNNPASPAVAVFVRTLRIGVGRNDKIDYRIEIFEIPTKDLKRLSE
jgi:hypothetical protein